ncbi:MAG: hypothetical protein IKX25_12585 [Bacteroidales bacterium]|nr:hypothetical protein [Bacteroidales bacterium]
MKSNLIFIAIALALVSCSGSNAPSAKQRRAEQLEKYRTQLQTERQTLKATDSIMASLMPEINTAKGKGFEYEKTQYDDLGRFRPIGMDPSENLNKSYLRCAVDDYGRTQLIATYCGPKTFVVHQVRINASDGTEITTKTIEPNDGTNYSYDIGGTHYQAVTFTFAGKITEGMTKDSTVLANADTDNGALGFIAQHVDDKNLKANYISTDGKEQMVNIGPKTRARMAATYELGVLLREFTRLQQENKTAGLKIQYLEQMILRKEIEEESDSD